MSLQTIHLIIHSYFCLIFSAKNELFHLCAEIEETGESPPTFEDVISMILEDVLGNTSTETSTEETAARRRSLHEVHRTLLPSRRRALRAHHLPHNRFIRPQRHLQEEEDNGIIRDLIDSLSVTGGFDGAKIFIRFELDVSKQAVESLDELIQAPLDLLNEVDFISNIFPGNEGSSPNNLESDLDLSASAHIGVLGKD